MGNALDANARALWLMVRNDGGWWTVSQLTHYWRTTFSAGEVQDYLEALRKGGFLARKAVPGMAWAYAVTPECKPLPGLAIPVSTAL